jgi:tyrosinase
MAGVRRNILTDATARDQYIEGALLLKAEQLGPTTTSFGIPGPALPVNTWDLFVAWHHIAMNRFTPPSQMDRNAAHRGPVFLPWHRSNCSFSVYSRTRTSDCPTGTGPPTVLSPAQQRTSALWDDDTLGGQGSPVSTGPFAFDAVQADSWRVLIATDAQGALRSTNRGLPDSLDVA